MTMTEIEPQRTNPAGYTVAKMGKKPKRDDPKPTRGPGRPPTGVETDSFCCRVSKKLIAAFEELADMTGADRAGTELRRSAEDRLIHMYRVAKDSPSNPAFRGVSVTAFLKAAEEYLREAGRWPLPSDRA